MVLQRIKALMQERGAARTEEAISEDEYNALRDRVAAEQRVDAAALEAALLKIGGQVVRRKKMN